MKAEHRKELQTNVLADRVGKFLQNLRAKQTTTSWVVLGLLVLAVAVFFGWRYFHGLARAKESALSRLLMNADSEEKLRSIMDDYKGTWQARVAGLQLAQKLYDDGFGQLASDSKRDEARKKVEEARDLFDQLGDDKGLDDYPTLRQEAKFGSAKTREALGDLDTARDYYEQAAKIAPDTFRGKDSEARARRLQDPDVRRFYAEFGTRLGRR
jgi:tetratricopeptide (TPR) repeat protein